MFGIGTTELVIILIVIFLLFGARRLPELGKGLGEGMRSFRDAIKGPPPSPQPPATQEPAPVQKAGPDGKPQA